MYDGAEPYIEVELDNLLAVVEDHAGEAEEGLDLVIETMKRFKATKILMPATMLVELHHDIPPGDEE